MTAVLPTQQSATGWSRMEAAGMEYLRLPLHTRWLKEDDELVLSLKQSLQAARIGDTVAISEKVVILLTGRAVDIGTVQPGRLARFLARHVHPRRILRFEPSHQRRGCACAPGLSG